MATHSGDKSQDKKFVGDKGASSEAKTQGREFGVAVTALIEARIQEKAPKGTGLPTGMSGTGKGTSKVGAGNQGELSVKDGVGDGEHSTGDYEPKLPGAVVPFVGLRDDNRATAARRDLQST